MFEEPISGTFGEAGGAPEVFEAVAHGVDGEGFGKCCYYTFSPLEIHSRNINDLQHRVPLMFAPDGSILVKNTVGYRQLQRILPDAGGTTTVRNRLFSGFLRTFMDMSGGVLVPEEDSKSIKKRLNSNQI